jgi:glycopeptide antibiotics resistance protein
MVASVYKYILPGALTIAILWLLFGPLHIETLWWRELLNSGHTILFFVLSLLFYWNSSALKAGEKTGVRWISNRYVKVFIICLLLNVAIELLQLLVNREVSIDDIYRGMMGTMAGLSLSVLIDMRNAGQAKIVPVLSLSCVFFLLAGMSPLVKLSVHYAERSRAFPVVMDFNSDWSESFVRHQDGTYSGIHIIEPEPDWQGYDSLSFDVRSNNDSTIRVGFRVHDNRHNNEHNDRFNSELTVRPGYNSFEVPLESIETGPLRRQLDLGSVSGVIFFSKDKEEWGRIEVSNLTLK